MTSLFIDFNHFDLDLILDQTKSDEYFIKIGEFLTKYFHQGYFTSFTSGSTGEPKEWKIENPRADASAQTSNTYFGIKTQTHFLLCLDIRFIGSKLMLIRALLAKAKITIVKPSLKFYEEISGQKFDFVSLTPLHIHYLNDHNPRFFDHVKTCLIGSSSVTYSLERSIQAYPQTQFYESFGMTETLSHIAIRHLSRGEESFELLDGFEIEFNQDDCLIVYHPMILPQRLVTNDIVKILDNRHFVYKGRKDNVINSGGIKYNPEYIENKLSPYLDFPFIIASESNETYGEQIILICQSDKTKTEIFELISQTEFLKREIPKEIYRSIDWPQTQSLKPIRSEILQNKIWMD